MARSNLVTCSVRSGMWGSSPTILPLGVPIDKWPGVARSRDPFVSVREPVALELCQALAVVVSRPVRDLQGGKASPAGAVGAGPRRPVFRSPSLEVNGAVDVDLDRAVGEPLP